MCFEENQKPLRERPTVTQDLYTLKNMRRCFLRKLEAPAGASTTQDLYTLKNIRRRFLRKQKDLAGASTRNTGLVYTQNYGAVFLKKTKAPAGASTRNTRLVCTQEDKKVNVCFVVLPMGSPIEKNRCSQWFIPMASPPFVTFVCCVALVLLFVLWCLPMGVPLKQRLILENGFSQ